MKRLTDIIMRMLPVCLVIVLTLFLTTAAYHQMVDAETERCWEILEESTERVTTDVRVRFADNASMLALAADAIAMKTDSTGPEVVAYLATVQEKTMFDRIQILYPDDTMLNTAGERINVKAYANFGRLSQKGPHVSRRITDPLTGREAIYCITPIVRTGETAGLLIGMLDCGTLHEQFPTSIFDGEAQIFLIDRTDGKYLMDNWHESLSSLHELGQREMLPGYEGIDFVREMLAGQKNMVAFYSQTNGKVSYQCYVPVEGFNWSLALVVQDEQVFANVEELKQELNRIGLIVAAVLLLYLIWNVVITSAAIANKRKMHRLQQEHEANEAKSRFLANMSHDIRTPLNGIIGMVDLLKRHGDDPARVENSLNKIDVSARYLLTLANDMLDLNEMENGQIKLTSGPIDIHRLGSDLTALMQPRAQEAGIAYHTIFGDIAHPYVLGSIVHVERVMVNLISNAIKYNREKGEVWVTIDEKSCAGDRVTFRFEVRDTGVGMSEAFQKNMFSSFEQEDAGARTTFQGYGLGLPIVRKLVGAMKGQIEVQSRKGEGSAFTVLLTFQVDQSRQVAREMLSEVFHREQDLSGARVLLAEDNELNMEIAEALLTDAGASVTKAFNGQEAVEIFRTSAPGTFNVILMDIMMPVMNGYDATRAIRAMDRPDAKQVAIMAMTAITFAEDVQKCLDAGMDEHIAKPLDMSLLTRCVAKYLHQNGKTD